MDRDSPSLLTERQEQCLRLAGERLTSKEIAQRLHIEPGTVDQHIKAAMRLLGVTTRREAAEKLAAAPNQPLDSQLPCIVSAPLSDLAPAAGSVASGRDLPPKLRMWPSGDLDWNDLLPWQRTLAIGGAALAGVIVLIALVLATRLAIEYGNHLP